MATIVLSAAGMAIGGAVGGSVMGLSSAVIGRAIGATLGRSLDQRLLGAGSDPVETGRVDRFRLTGASEGAPVGQVYGRTRVGGQIIWATEFKESKATTGGGKGAASRPRVTEYSYSVSLAVALCEGEITGVGRVWADGAEVAPEDLNMRIYHGAADQMPDPRIEAVEGAGMAPAYRGTAYVVLEDLDLGQFGNRVPQFTFEVMRPAQPEMGDDDIARAVRAVTLIPGTGEYALATRAVYLPKALGQSEAANINSPSGKADFVTSVDALEAELPNCRSVSLVVSWFGSDLRCDQCKIKPKVDQKEADGNGMAWRASGETRASAELVPQVDGATIYGGTPADASVVQAIQDLTQRRLSTVFYPFVLMDQIEGNGLPDPWGAEEQAHLPWRGRITTSLAAGMDRSPDGTAAADAEVAAFFGQACASDFSTNGLVVSYSGPLEWSYRRFILHYAHLCAAAGGVDGFIIGSELRGLTQIRGASGYPVVEALVDLLHEVRSILGPDTKLSYAADWSEYHGHQPAGTSDKVFHLDDFWADPDCDFVGIDNYLPLSDWRDGDTHKDAGWGSIYNLDYLRSNIEGGEYYDWYYHSPEAVEAQIRTPITDGEGEPWIWRAKDIRNWWANPHHNREGGVRSGYATAWIPESKPIWFTEIGCAAVDKGTNEPNRFLDPKSSESGLPRASNGVRDEFIQMQYLRAMLGYYDNVQNNPLSGVTGEAMIDLSRLHVWAWDARPYPAFPARSDVWADGDNYARGHWLNGRASARSLASVVREICVRSGIENVDVTELYGLVRGYSVPDLGTAREALQPLMLAYGFDAIERDGALVFRSRDARVDAVLEVGNFAQDRDEDGPVELTRAQEPEIAGRVQLSYVEADADYEVRATEAVFPGDGVLTTSRSEVPLVLTEGEGLRIAERWLSEARVARDASRFALPPSAMHLGPGDVVRLPDGQGDGLYRIDTSEQTERQTLEAVRIEPSVYERQDVPEAGGQLRSFVPPVPVAMMMMDLPLIRGNEDEIAPHVAVSGVPWPGSVALYASDQDAGYGLSDVFPSASVIGVTESEIRAAQPGLWDRGPALRVRLIRGELSAAAVESVLSGANVAAIGDGSAETWEVFQFAEAELVEPGTYDIRMRLRGQAGSDGIMPAAWPVGSVFVVMDGTPAQIELSPNARGVERHYRYGPASRPLDDPSYQYRSETFRGNGLRPYRVAHLQAEPDGASINLRWVRRTRIDGDGWETTEAPLGEAIEAYQVRVSKNGAVLREAIVNSPIWSYSGGMQSSDGASGEVLLEVAQLSERFGVGPFHGVSVTL